MAWKQAGSVYLKERKLKVQKPRLRKKGGGVQAEVAVPAYEAMQDQTGMGSRILEILLEGVSTRQYGAVIPKMADTVGVSKSSVSRAAIQASEAQLDKLLNRRFDDLDVLIIYVDGMHFGEQCVIGAVGVDEHGQKHVLGLQEGATENAAAAKDLLEDLVRRGVKPERRRLFVIDGSKALRAAINAVFGSASLVQRCRQHKLRNVAERLPKDQQEQTKSLMRAAWRLEAKEGIGKLEKLAKWLEREHPDAADSLREGMEECFTIITIIIPKAKLIWRRINAEVNSPRSRFDCTTRILRARQMRLKSPSICCRYSRKARHRCMRNSVAMRAVKPGCTRRNSTSSRSSRRNMGR